MKKTDRKLLERNITKLCLIMFLDGMWFGLPIYMIFFMDNGMSFTQIGIIWGASSIMPFFFDIPSSIWADKYSRRLVVILSSITFLFSNILFYLAHSFEVFFLSACLNGIGIALSTGIFSALIYDTLLSLGKEKEYEKIQSRVMKSFFVGRIVASAVGAYVYYFVNPRLVFLLSVFVSVISLGITFYLKEPPREKSISHSFNQIREGLNYLLEHKTIWETIIIFAVMGSTCDVLFNYYQPVMQVSGIPVVYFGIIYIIVNFLSFLGANYYPKIKKKIDWKNIMIAYLVIDFIASMLLGTQIAALVLFSIMLLSFSFGTHNTYITGIVHKIVPSSHRATTISIQSQAYMLSFLIFMNVVSFIIDRSSIFIGMLVNALFVLMAILIFLKISYSGELAKES